MTTIWKFPLTTQNGSEFVQMPKGAIILCAQTQHNVPYLWAEVDPEAKLDSRLIAISGTGRLMPETYVNRQYIDTFQLHGGELVFHVYELH